MSNYFKKTVIRLPFDAALNRLKDELHKEGFEVGGVTDFQAYLNNAVGSTRGKHSVLAICNPYLYTEMLSLSPFEGIVLPCSLSLMEVHPGETAIIPYNSTEKILECIESPSMKNLAAEVSRRLSLAIHGLAQEQAGENKGIAG